MSKAIFTTQNIRGFTLIELMVTLSILAIITLIATPSLASALENQKLKQAAIDVKVALQDLRSQSVLTNSERALCIATPAESVAECGKSLKNYAQLNDNQKQQRIDALHLDKKVYVKQGSSTEFVFTSQGYTTQQTLTLCAGERSYAITVYMPGHVDVSQAGACT